MTKWVGKHQIQVYRLLLNDKNPWMNRHRLVDGYGRYLPTSSVRKLLESFYHKGEVTGVQLPTLTPYGLIQATESKQWWTKHQKTIRDQQLGRRYERTNE